MAWGLGTVARCSFYAVTAAALVALMEQNLARAEENARLRATLTRIREECVIIDVRAIEDPEKRERFLALIRAATGQN